MESLWWHLHILYHKVPNRSHYAPYIPCLYSMHVNATSVYRQLTVIAHPLTGSSALRMFHKPVATSGDKLTRDRFGLTKYQNGIHSANITVRSFLHAYITKYGHI